MRSSAPFSSLFFGGKLGKSPPQNTHFLWEEIDRGKSKNLEPFRLTAAGCGCIKTDNLFFLALFIFGSTLSNF